MILGSLAGQWVKVKAIFYFVVVGVISSLQINFIVPCTLAKEVDIKTHLSVRLSVTKTLISLISSEVLMIEHLYMYVACTIFMISLFNWHHAMTLMLTFDLNSGQICCHAGDRISPNLLVIR